MPHESKAHLSKRILAELDGLQPDDIANRAAIIVKRIFNMEEFQSAKRIGLYASKGNEVRTDLIFTEADRRRKEMYYPVLEGTNKFLSYYRAETLDDLTPGDEGRVIPKGIHGKLRDLNDLQMLIVPGVAFDHTGARLGRGGGLFDACLKNFRGTRIALAYDFQLLDNLPLVHKGRKVDWIITEKQMIRC